MNHSTGGGGAFHGMLYDIPMVQQAYDNGGFVVIGWPIVGPMASEKAPMLSIIDRPEMMQYLEHFRGLNRADRRRMIRSVVGALATAARAKTGAELSNDPDFLADMGILAAAVILYGPDATEGSGMKGMQLVVHPDESRAWERRGMLDPGTEHRLFGGKPAVEPVREPSRPS